MAAALGRLRKFDEAEKLLTELESEDAWDWRVLWHRAVILLLRQKAAEAAKLFDQVYFDLPGEVAPKLALGLAAEISGNSDLAIHMYDLVSRTDSNHVSASFGLARCFRAKGDRKAAVEALGRIPQSSAIYIRSRVEVARTLAGQTAKPDVADLEAASAVCESIVLEGASRQILNQEVLRSALLCLRSGSPVQGKKVLGGALEETQVRSELERSLRALARMSNGEERIRLVEQANEVRPWTMV